MAIFKLFFLSTSAELSKTGVNNSFLILKVNSTRICVATGGDLFVATGAFNSQHDTDTVREGY